jgi:multidrug resistance efflux pump
MSESLKENLGENTKKKGSGKKVVIALLVTLVLLAGAGVGGFFLWQSAGYLVTDNARVTTNLSVVTPTSPGTLERFNLYEGRHVSADEILGWVENDAAMRSTVDGLVVYTSAAQGQSVMPGEQLAIIADINNIHIQANFEETEIRQLRVGQPVAVTIDAFGNRQFTGFISDIGRITVAELTGQAMFFNTGGTFTRVTHLIPVEITLVDAGDAGLENFIGMNAAVRIPLR